jgi:hypothetical protein
MRLAVDGNDHQECSTSYNRGVHIGFGFWAIWKMTNQYIQWVPPAVTNNNGTKSRQSFFLLFLSKMGINCINVTTA